MTLQPLRREAREVSEPKTFDELLAVIDGDARATGRFAVWIGPTLVAAARKAIRAYRLNADLEDDLVQEVFVGLFRDQSRALRRWDPNGGRSLKAFLFVFAWQRIIEYVRRLGHDLPTEDEKLLGLLLRAERGGVNDGDAGVIDIARDVERQFLPGCSSEDRQIFEGLIAGRSTAELTAITGLDATNVHAHVSRLRRRLRAFLSVENPSHRIVPQGTQEIRRD